jgi:hypothetical protein
MQTEINVTLEDILRGKSCKLTECPIALAIKRHTKDNIAPSVGPDGVEWFDSGYETFVINELSGDVLQRIQDFDDGGGMEPFRFYLDIPDEFVGVSGV